MIDSLVGSTTKEQQTNSINLILRQIEEKNGLIQKLCDQIKTMEKEGEDLRRSRD